MKFTSDNYRKCREKSGYIRHKTGAFLTFTQGDYPHRPIK